MSKTFQRRRDRQRDEETLTVSDQHELLASSKRRTVLGVLNERRLPIEIDVLARAVLAREPGQTDERRETVQITLHHNHLPKLASAGLIDYDPEAGRVESYHPLQ